MKDRNLLSKVGGKHPQELRRQGDLGHQNQGASPPVQHLLDEADVHLGLAAARHAVQERHGGLSLPAQPVQPLQSGLLFLIELLPFQILPICREDPHRGDGRHLLIELREEVHETGQRHPCQLVGEYAQIVGADH